MVRKDIKQALKKISPKNTPLAHAVEDGKNLRISPLELLRLARRHWLKGEKVSIDRLAKESGVSRVTIYRWVGSKDYLMGEVLWSAFEPGMNKIIKETPGTGIEHIVDVHRQLMILVLSFPPMQHFIKDDPAYALRLVTTPASCVRERVVKAIVSHLNEEEANGHIRLPAPAKELSEMIIRANESLMYSDAISGRSPAIEQACNMVRMLLTVGTTYENPKKIS